MPYLNDRIAAFSALGKLLRSLNNREQVDLVAGGNLKEKVIKLYELIETAQQYNGWFSPDFVKHALISLGESLQNEKLEQWIENYKEEFNGFNASKTVAVVMAGNVPAVGFHDFLSILISGHRILAKLSSDDDKLIPAIADILIELEPGFAKYIEFTGDQLKNFDAVIATGSNNTSRYFDYYFGKYPNIIRKNRNGVAILTGSESQDELEALADDVFLYYGLGCRNVARLFVPANYNFNPILEVFAKRKEIAENNKYYNNYEYNKAIYLINSSNHFDTGNLLLTENSSFASPVSVLYYSFYQNPEALNNELMITKHQVQCVVSATDLIKDKIPFGKSQSPELWDYADGVDTMKFLLSIE
jgi:hypothetical protein